MEQETGKDFVLEEDKNGCAGKCPLAQIPANVWIALLKPPFRKRHPLIFWLSIIILAAICIGIARFAFSGKNFLPEEDRIALIGIQGPIMDAGPTLAWIRKVAETPGVKGVLVRVDSPGGGAAASQEIYAALARLAKTKPMAVSMGATAASGGLMVSMAGQRIFANPSTVTGSIGVRMDIPQLQGLMGKIGVGQETLVTAPYKDAASYLHPLTPQDRAYLEGVIENMHRQFVEIVAKGRGMSYDKAKELANGKVFTGEQALALGLVDVLGGQDDAQAWLCQKTGIPMKRKMITRPKRERGFIQSLLTMFNLGEFLGIFTDFDPEGLAARLSQPSFLYQWN